MGKGQIISGGDNGQYQVRVQYDRTQYDNAVAALDNKISDLTLKSLSLEGRVYDLAILQISALQKRKAFLQDNTQDDFTVSAWCADLTEDLAGDVGTIEVPGESVHIQIHPGYNGNAAYNASRDGQLAPTMTMTPAQAFYNMAMLPGWQKWKPTFRYGTISNIVEDKCTIDFGPAASSQQSLNVNQSEQLENVDIEYMQCNGAAFSDGDEVLVMFGNQDWSQPKVIGFRQDPQPCGDYMLVTLRDLCFVWDLENDQLADDIKNNSGNVVVFPVETEAISNWIAKYTESGTPLFSTDSAMFDPDFPQPLGGGGNGSDTGECGTITYDASTLEPPDPYTMADENGNTSERIPTLSYSRVVKFITFEGQPVLDTRNITWDYSFGVDVGGMGVVSQEFTATANIANPTRGFALAATENFHREIEYVSQTSDRCGFPDYKDGLYEYTNLVIDVDYVLKSPFSDDGQHAFSVQTINEAESSQPNGALETGTIPDCSAYRSEQTVENLNLNTGGIRGTEADSINYAVVFYAVNVQRLNSAVDGCGEFILVPTYALYNGSCEAEWGSSGSSLRWHQPCDPVPVETVDYDEAFGIKIYAFSQKVNTPDQLENLNPYEIPQSAALTTAMTGMYNQLKTELGGHFNPSFDIKFLT